VSPSDDLSLVNDDAADGNSALLQPKPGFGDGGI